MIRWHRGFHDDGFLLPVVIALGLAISVVSLSALTTLAQNSSMLNAQYYNDLAAEAARAGVNAAIKCINNSTFDWGTGGKPTLQPQTDCHGATVTGQPVAVLDDGTVATTYSVTALDNPYNGNTRVINSTGTATVKTGSG